MVGSGGRRVLGDSGGGIVRVVVGSGGRRVLG